MIERPVSTEAAPYYSKYIERVPNGDVMQVLAAQLDEATAYCSGISEERSRHRYAPEKWSIREVWSHITDTERVFAFRAFWFARGFEAAMPSFDQEVAMRASGAEDIDWPAHIEEFRRVRLSTISLFENLPAQAWGRRGIASDNFVSVRALAFITAGHFAHHLALLRERY